MAEKTTRGLPDDFSLSDAEDLPAAPGDFLDEMDSHSDLLLRRSLARAKTIEPPPQPRPPSVIQGALRGSAPQTSELPVIMAARETIAAQLEKPSNPPVATGGEGEETKFPQKKSSLSPAWKRQLRRQLNMSAEVEHLVESLLGYFRQYGPQDDIKMSELFEALVRLAHDCKDQLDLSRLPKRGAWGSASERNFPVAIAEALVNAIVRSQKNDPKLAANS